MRPRLLIAALLALAAAVALLVWPHSRPGSPRTRGFAATVVRPVDGDTLVARAAGRTFYVRLLGIDTPETHRPGTPVECGGPQASARMNALAPPGAHIRLESDPTQDRVDRYGRAIPTRIRRRTASRSASPAAATGRCSSTPARSGASTSSAI